ncbi:ankyrin repeat and SOCS box protein 3-like [Branchiostoma lanceolatum]|uniref:ankyrin repeat and SOCS box protein 3-like n=1 Tax=Branchiostoma lanceolatum TaxID=7740 RepID=UPI003454EF3C
MAEKVKELKEILSHVAENGPILTPNTALMAAAVSGSVQGVKEALKAGADIEYDLLDSTGTALYTASYNGHADVVRLLLRKGASVAKRCGPYAPLHEAASYGWTEVVELLVNHGATLDVQDDFHDTPLIRACVYKQVDTVRRLIELGARVDLIADYGEVAQRFYPYGMKEDRRWEECMKLIEEARETRLLRCCNPKCGKPGYRSTLKLCGRCKMTRYCNRDCQKQHWSVGHKKCCGQDTYSEDPIAYREMVYSLVDVLDQYLDKA